MEEPKELNIQHEDLYSMAIGEIGKWQMLIFALAAVPAKVVLPSIQFGIIFMAPKTTFRCVERVDELNSEEPPNMTCYSDCMSYEYFSDIENSIIKQWELICGRAWLADFAQTICMFGILIGSVVFGVVSDRYGRRLSLIIAGSLQTCMSFAMPFCPNFWSLIAVRFFLGAASGGTMLTTIVLLMEIFGSTTRELLGCIYILPVSFGYILMAIIVYYVRTWREFSVVFAAPTLVYLTYVFWLPESPQWLISGGKLDEAAIIMTSAAKCNKLPSDDMREIVARIANEEASTQKTRRKATLKDFVMLPSLRMTSLYSCVIWFTSGLTYYGSNQYFGQTSSNVFLTFFLVGVVELIGFILGPFVSKTFGRRVAIISFYFVSTVGNGFLVLPDDWYYLKLIAGTIGIGSSGAVFSLIYVYTSELFPTVARNMGVGVASTANRLGSMLAPFVGSLRVQAPWIPPVVFAVAPILGIAACWRLPETRGKRLERHLDEA